jgi:hypothetical protein
MCGLLALVVRKGSNFDPLLCGLSPPVSKVRLLASIYTYWPAESFNSETLLPEITSCPVAHLGAIWIGKGLRHRSLRLAKT